MVFRRVAGLGAEPTPVSWRRPIHRGFLATPCHLADADFDGEWVHEHVRDDYGIRTVIPAERGRPSDKPPAGRWRRWMRRRLDKKKYGQRWQTETANSMIKRRLGSALRARSYWSQCREIILRVITHNVMIMSYVSRAFTEHFDLQYRKGRIRSRALDQVRPQPPATLALSVPPDPPPPQ